MFPTLKQFGILTVFMFFVLSTRYLTVSSVLYWLLWVRRPPSWEVRRLHDMHQRKSKMKSEIKWSLFSCFIFALPSAFMIEMINLGYTKVYGLWLGLFTFEPIYIFDSPRHLFLLDSSLVAYS
jgi:hypothetical protein